ncbi:MAG: TetR/AcrR family transcriptional regulator [Coprobacillus sp.]
MKENITSQEKLIEIAKQIILKEGVASLSIRKIARECEISVGVFYNYFETKGDLLFTIVSDYWQGLMENEQLRNQEMVCDFAKNLYVVLVDKLEDFENTWLMQMSLLDYSEREKGKQLEHQCFSHIINQIIEVINKDQYVKEDVFNDVLTKESFAHFVLMNIISIARNQHQNCDAFIEILKRILYK